MEAQLSFHLPSILSVRVNYVYSGTDLFSEKIHSRAVFWQYQFYELSYVIYIGFQKTLPDFMFQIKIFKNGCLKKYNFSPQGPKGEYISSINATYF